jgi:16S rRNA (adenine1518-N6/adenine1519-N6)-dimethyltransferase
MPVAVREGTPDYERMRRVAWSTSLRSGSRRGLLRPPQSSQRRSIFLGNIVAKRPQQFAAKQPRKRFGQNFLTDAGVINRIERAISPRQGDHLVEIGPGRGALTEALVESGCRLDAIELDRDLRTPLLAAFSVHPNFTLHSADALTFDYRTLVGEAPGNGVLRIVGNLPYNISTPLIFHLLDAAAVVEDMHFMLQLEVVQRLTAAPGDRHWGRLAIMSQFRCEAEALFEVPPEAFEPPPKVQSAVVRLTPHPAPRWPEIDAGTLGRVVKLAFSQRRKTLRNTLKPVFSEAEIAEVDIDPGARAETLDMAAYLRLTQRLQDREAP